jgi:hypothetical protein
MSGGIEVNYVINFDIMAGKVLRTSLGLPLASVQRLKRDGCAES